MTMQLPSARLDLVVLMTLALTTSLCNADAHVLADAIKLNARVPDGLHEATAASSSYRRQLKRTATSEEINITQGYYEAEILSSDDITIAFEVGSGIGDVHCEILLEGGITERTISPCQSPIHLVDTLDRDGVYGFIATGIVTQTDEKVSAVSTWGLDREPPETSLTDVKGVAERTMKFSFTGIDQYGVASYECNVDHTEWRPCTSPETVDVHLSGHYCFEVRAVDFAGNVDPHPVHFEWMADYGHEDYDHDDHGHEDHDPSDHDHSVMSFSASESDSEDHENDHRDHHSDSNTPSKGAIVAAVLTPSLVIVSGFVIFTIYVRRRLNLEAMTENSADSKDIERMPAYPVIYESGSDHSQFE